MTDDDPIDRRSVLRTGAALLGAAGLSGCAAVRSAVEEQASEISGGGSDSGGAADGADLRSITYGETKEGFVDEADGRDPEWNDLAEPVSFEGSGGDRVRITMRTNEFDAYVVLEGPNGGTVAEIDDGGGGLDSQGTVTLQASGTYTIWAGSIDGEATGPYTLTVESVGDSTEAGGDTEAAAGDSRDLRSISYGETKEGYVDQADGRDPEWNDLAEPVEFEGSSGDRVRITMRTDAFDAFVVVEGPNGETVAEIDDGGGGLDSQGTVTLQASGTYTIWAGSIDGEATGPYTLTLEQV